MSGIYDEPEVYELACAYRDVPAEVDALCGWYRAHAGRVTGGSGRGVADRSPPAVLEVAAGPAEHALEFARRGFAATALDISGAMCARARQKADREGLPVTVVQADMRDFTIPDRFGLVIAMLNSICHLTTLDDFVAHLRAVARHTVPGSVYIMELAHPADHFTQAPRTSTQWRTERDGVRAEVRWGGPGDVIDPVTQVTMEHVRITVHDATGSRTFTDVVPNRFWTATELTAAVALAGGFTIAARYGDFAGDIPVDSHEAWRMILVLRRD